LGGESLSVAPTADPHRVRLPSGVTAEVPAGWVLLAPGDAMLTRRVKAAGPTWTVVEKRGRKTFSRGVWAPAAQVEAARAATEARRADPAYARKLAADARRRAEEQAAYAGEFEAAVRAFLAFAPAFAAEERALAAAVAAHAAPVGSGTVARTARIPVAERAAAAVIAWLRHRTTAYDELAIPRVRGARREVRRALAAESRALLARHRRGERHAAGERCPLCTALAPGNPGARP
jgi:hypothetical protein